MQIKSRQQSWLVICCYIVVRIVRAAHLAPHSSACFSAIKANTNSRSYLTPLFAFARLAFRSAVEPNGELAAKTEAFYRMHHFTRYQLKANVYIWLIRVLLTNICIDFVVSNIHGNTHKGAALCGAQRKQRRAADSREERQLGTIKSASALLRGAKN